MKAAFRAHVVQLVHILASNHLVLCEWLSQTPGQRFSTRGTKCNMTQPKPDLLRSSVGVHYVSLPFLHVSVLHGNFIRPLSRTCRSGEPWSSPSREPQLHMTIPHGLSKLQNDHVALDVGFEAVNTATGHDSTWLGTWYTRATPPEAPSRWVAW